MPPAGHGGFQGGPVCTRFERGKTFILPGCRGPEDPGYDLNVDGNPFLTAAFNRPIGGGAGITLPGPDFPPITVSNQINFSEVASSSAAAP